MCGTMRTQRTCKHVRCQSAAGISGFRFVRGYPLTSAESRLLILFFILPANLSTISLVLNRFFRSRR